MLLGIVPTGSFIEARPIYEEMRSIGIKDGRASSCSEKHLTRDTQVYSGSSFRVDGSTYIRDSQRHET